MSENEKTVIRSSLWQDLKDIWSKATLISACLTVPTLGLAGMATHIIDPVRPLAEAFALTWPLVCSATILIMLLMRLSFTRMEPPEIIWSIVAIALVPYLIAFAFGMTGFIDPRTIKDHWSGWLELLTPGKVLLVVYNIGTFYFSAFGLWRVVVALTCGGFLAWVFQYKLLPYVVRK